MADTRPAARAGDLDSTSHKDFDRAYQWMAPSYTNMVTKEQFSAAMATNKNFERHVTLEVSKTVSSNGSMTFTGSFGDLGRADVTFADTPAGPRISGIAIGGTAALPSPHN
jgi:hypothetical protein